MNKHNDHNWRRIPLKDIDSVRWEKCIFQMKAPVFAELWYWKSINLEFETWVKGDYESVLALPVKKKWGIVPTMRMPLYIKWLVGDREFMSIQLKRFWGWRKVFVPFEIESKSKHNVQVLKLNFDWVPTKELKKKIRKCEEEQYVVTEASWSDFMHMMRDHHPYAWPLVQQQTLHRLYDAAHAKGKGKIFGVKKEEQWIALQFFVMSRDQVSLIQNVSDSAYRNHDPMTFLLCSIFDTLKSSVVEMEVNFMGSDHPGVAQYNKKFGAIDQAYWEW